jgi:diguanylate cyclase (GGDEF)-like protein
MKDEKIYTISREELDIYLDRRQKRKYKEHLDLTKIMGEALIFANKFIATSNSGSIYLDDPESKVFDSSGKLDYEKLKLIFTACYGKNSAQLVGKRIPATKGIVGKVYRTGEGVLVNDAQNNSDFNPEFDQEINYKSEKILSVPIRIGDSTVGVLQLINKKSKGKFSHKELDLLSYFCDRYISPSMIRAIEVKKDSLTGLYNQNYFEYKIHEILFSNGKPKQEYYLFYIDLDNFKEVNDLFGHEIGSDCILAVANLLNDLVLKYVGKENLIGRFGGDEFEIFLFENDLEKVKDFAKKIINGVQHLSFRVSLSRGGEVDVLRRVTCSIGIASSLNDFSNVKQYIKLADKAMYIAKAQKNRIYMVKEGFYEAV